LKFKDGSDFAMRRRKVAFEAEAALADAGKPVPIVAELQRKRRQFGWPDHIEPQWIDCAGVIPRVQHGKAVDIEPRVLNWQRRRRRRYWSRTGRKLRCARRRPVAAGRRLRRRCLWLRSSSWRGLLAAGGGLIFSVRFGGTGCFLRLSQSSYLSP